MSRVTIREGRKEDLPQVLELIMELADFTGYRDQVSNSVEQMEEDGFGENPIFGFLVADNNGYLEGTSIYYYRYSTWKRKRLYLEDLVVRKDLRGKGIGTLLFEATMQKSLSENCSGMMWQVLHWNEKAITFYKKYGAKFEAEFTNCNLEAGQMKSLLK